MSSEKLTETELKILDAVRNAQGLTAKKLAEVAGIPKCHSTVYSLAKRGLLKTVTVEKVKRFYSPAGRRGVGNTVFPYHRGAEKGIEGLGEWKPVVVGQAQISIAIDIIEDVVALLEEQGKVDDGAVNGGADTIHLSSLAAARLIKRAVSIARSAYVWAEK